MRTILEQWQRLILPPEGVPLRGSVQRDDHDGSGEIAPDQPMAFRMHLAGLSTYAIEPAWTDTASGEALTKVGVLAVAIAGDADVPGTAQALHRAAAEAGLAAALAWSGTGACHVWLFAEAMPVPIMTAALRRLAAAVPQTGAPVRNDVVPQDRPRILLPPGWHRGARGWAYFYKADESPTPVDAEVVPAGLFDYQLDILASIVPTTAAALHAFARTAAPLPVATMPQPAPAPTPIPPPTSASASPRIELADLRLSVTDLQGGTIGTDLEPLEALDLAARLIDAARRRLDTPPHRE